MPDNRIRKHYVETSRGLVHVQEAGLAGPVLVLVTITSFASPAMGRLVAELSARGWHALSFDLMGYGRSDKRQGHWLVEDFADNLLEAVAERGVSPFGLVFGHFSSWTGIEIASRRPLALSGLRAMVLDGTPCCSAAQRAEMQANGAAVPQPWDADGGHALAYWQKVWRILHQLDPERPLDGVPSQHFREATMCLLEASIYEPNTALAAARFEIEHKLPLVDLPVLAVCSDTDWNLRHHEGIVAALPWAESLRLGGVHPMHALQQPERAGEYAALLNRYFRRYLTG